MSTSAIALPRLRARRRRRKPMPPSLRFWLACVLINSVSTTSNLIALLLGGHVALVGLGISVPALIVAWHFFVPEWRAWRDDDAR